MGLEKITKIRKDKGWTIEQLAEKSKIPVSTIKKVSAGITGNPSFETVLSIAKALECSLEEFIDEPIAKTVSLKEQRHLDRYRALDCRGKNVVEAVLEHEYAYIKEVDSRRCENEKSEKIIHLPKREVPLYDVRVSAGTGQFLDSSSYTMVELEDNEPPETSFLVNVTGDSMEPTYFAGDTLYIKQQREIELGEIGIFMINGDIFVKELSEGGLKSHNSVYPVIPFSSTDTIHCYGKVLGIREI